MYLVFEKRSKLHYYVEVGTPGYDAISKYASNKFCFYGIVLRVMRKGIYKIRLDLPPLNHNKVVICCNDITVLEKNEEKSPFDPKYKEKEDIIEECSKVRDNAGNGGKSKKKDHKEVSTKDFLDPPQEA